jgi:hypothetical protein
MDSVEILHQGISCSITVCSGNRASCFILDTLVLDLFQMILAGSYTPTFKGGSPL